MSWYGHITSKSQLIDEDSNENALKSMQSAADELRNIATKMREIADECGPEALTSSVGGVSKFIAGAIDFFKGLAPWNWGKEIVSSDPGAKSMERSIDETADIIEEYADALDEKAGKLYTGIRDQWRLQNNALDAYVAEQQRKANQEQGGGNNG